MMALTSDDMLPPPEYNDRGDGIRNEILWHGRFAPDRVCAEARSRKGGIK
jgi:hypothetical protein